MEKSIRITSYNVCYTKLLRATVKWASQQGFGTVLGLSNISFGLPERGWVNASFFAMAAGAGLSWAIANPSHELLMNTKAASDVLTGRDRDALSYIQRFAKDKNAEQKKETSSKKTADLPVEDQIVEAVIEGRREDIETLCNQALEKGIAPSELLEKKMISYNFV